MTRKPRRYALCVHAEGDLDLEPRKLYEVLPDKRAAADGYLRVIDESGEDYLYPARFFVPLPLPPEAELLKDIHILEDLLKHVEDEGERKSLAKSLQWKVIRLDMMKRRSLDLGSVRNYGRKLVEKFYRR